MLRSNIESVEEFQKITNLYLNKYCNENPITLIKEKLLKQENPWNQIRVGQLALIMAVCDMKIDNFFIVDWDDQELKYRARIKHHALMSKINIEKPAHGIVKKDIYHDIDNYQAEFDYLICFSHDLI